MRSSNEQHGMFQNKQNQLEMYKDTHPHPYSNGCACTYKYLGKPPPTHRLIMKSNTHSPISINLQAVKNILIVSRNTKNNTC